MRRHLRRLEEEPLVRQTTSPFSLMRRLTEDVERFFEDLGARGFFGGGLEKDFESARWAPAIEVVERDNEILVRAELPGLTKDDVKVDITEDALIIAGERKQEREEKGESFYRTERHYGRFLRTLPLPEGSKPEAARATFRDGVLEVVIPAPDRKATKARRLEIEAGPAKSGPKAA